MACYVTLILLYFGFSLNSCSHFPLRIYYSTDLKLNWADAQHYCRVKYTDLATFESMDDVRRLKPTFLYPWAWIGLRDDPNSWKVTMGNDTNSWRWSATGETSKTGFHNWNENEPTSGNAKENCVLINTNGMWDDQSCQSLKSFVCYTDKKQNEETYVFISSATTWNSAQAYCRQYFIDLPMIENSAENNAVISAKPASAEVWIGLYRVPWTWSDKTQSSFRIWQSDAVYPNNYGGNQFCMATNTVPEWDDSNCQSEMPFICHQVSKLKTMVRMKIETDADITVLATNAQILQQLGAVLKSRGWTDVNLQWKIQPRKQEKAKLT